jgi:hypothetical protein
MLMQSYLNKNSFREKNFRLRINEETFNVNIKFILYGISYGSVSFKDVTMVKISCVAISDIDFSEYGRRLIDNINNEF